MQRKGFTLIELLAVIVILAVVSLIATPIVMNIIDSAQKGAFKNTAYGIIKAGEFRYAQDVFSGENRELTFTYSDGIEQVSVGGKNLEYKGTRPQSGKVLINNSGQVAIAIYNGKWCAKKDYEESVVILTRTNEEDCIIGDEEDIDFVKIIPGHNFSLLLTDNGDVYMESYGGGYGSYILVSDMRPSGNGATDIAGFIYNFSPWGLDGMSEIEFEQFVTDNMEILTIVYMVYAYPDEWFDAFMNNDDEFMDDIIQQFQDPEFVPSLYDNEAFMSLHQGTIDELHNLIFSQSSENGSNLKKVNIEGVKDIHITYNDTTFFIMNSGKLLAIGENPGLGSHDPWGDGIDFPITAQTITEVPGLSNVKNVFSTMDDTYVLLENGDVYGWGYNFNEFLGNGTEGKLYTPTRINTLSNVKELILTEQTRFALMNDGTVKGWGWTDWGMVPIEGAGDFVSIPTTIAGLSNVKAIYHDAWDGRFSYALHNDNSVSVWGFNGSGQLGLGHTNNITTPTINPNFTDVKDIVLGEQHALVLSNNGTVKVVGTNISGVFGTEHEDWEEITTPVSIPGINAIAIAGNNRHTAIVDTNGNLFVAGENSKGELVIENSETIFTLTQVLEITDVKLISFERAYNIRPRANRMVIVSNNEVKAFGFSDYPEPM